MLIEYIAYTASLISYISQATGLGIQKVVTALGLEGVDRIARNAAMLRHLPVKRIAGELESDYWNVLGRADNSLASFNEAYGREVAKKIEAGTEDSHQYVTALYAALMAETV